MTKEFFSTSELARLMGVSRITVFKKIKSGKIKAEKIGRNYIIHKDEMHRAIGSALGDEKKKEIETAVGKAFAEYGEAFRKLGKE